VPDIVDDDPITDDLKRDGFLRSIFEGIADIGRPFGG